MKHFISSLSVINANTPPCEGRVSSRKILSLLLILFLSIGNVWAETVTWEKATSIAAGDVVALVCESKKKELSGISTTSTKYGTGVDYTSTPAGAYELTVEEGSTTGTFSFKNGSNYLYWYSGNTLNKTTTKNANASWTVTFSDGNAIIKNANTSVRQLQWNASSPRFACYDNAGQTAVQLYKKVTSSGGGDEPALSATPTEIDFGTVYQGPTVADKTVAVNFANLNGAVTYSGLSTPFTATGAISATGDNITISADASTIGEYSQTLTVASTADSKTAEVTVKMNVVEKPAPTGTFTLHTGDLMEGDYVIYYSGKAMKAEVASNRLQYVEVTPSNDEIVDPAAAAIWHIAKSGDNWTVYNNNAGYAAGTGTKSQAGLVANLTGDDANKAAWTVTASGNAYEFVNVWNTSKSVNATLRNNGTNGFACYATSTGGALSLYRKAGTKYNVTVSSTTNGSVTANPTSAEAGTIIALTVTPESGYVLDALTVTDASSNTIEVADNKFTMPASDVTVTATFKENEKPAATLTLSKNGETEDITGHKQGDKVELPSITSDCVKAFVGWSANANCATEPEYKEGDEYTLESTTQTLYAVYATVQGGSETTSEDLFENNGTYNATNPATIDWTLQNVISILQEQGTSTSAVNSSYDKDPHWYKSHMITITPSVNIAKIVTKAQSEEYATALANSTYTNATATVNGDIVTITPISANEVVTIKMGAQARLYTLTVTYRSIATYSDYSTTCAAAPKAEVNPTSVTANAAGANDKVEVTYENVNTESVAVALFNDEACTEAFSADWLTASLDGDKNITYTVAATTLYTERKAYIKLTAPETNGTTEPAKVVIPVTQAGKDKVFASLEALLAAITPTAEGVEVTVTLTNEVIQDFYTSSSYRNGIALNVPYEDGVKVIEIYCKDVPAEWVKGGKVSGTITCPWKLYNSTWELCPTAWTELTYTAPATVKSIAVSGTPTKTTYVDGEAFDPTGLVVTATLTDDSTEPIDVALVDWAFNPATLTKGETAVSVTATYNSVSSAAYEVTGLTVNDIPTKTVAEFIAVGGTRCYLEGIVSSLTEGNSMKYGNFDLTDASGTIYVYGCLNASGEKEKFADLGVKNGDKIKVIADEYELYGGTKDEAKNVQYVSHISAATIEIDDITLVEGDEHTIVAVVTPAEAVVTYTIKENTANAISLLDNTITALAEGTATITATVAEGAGYLANSVEFTVTVKEYVAPISGIWELVTDASTLKAGDKVIVAQYVETDGTIYTMGGQKTNNRDVVESSVLGETLTPTTGTAVLTLVDAGNGTFALQVDNGKYLYAASNTSNHLKETATVNDNAKWSVSVTDGKASVVAQGANTHNTIRFNKSNTPKIFSCYESGQQDIALYKKMPDYTRDVRQGYYGTICLPNGGMMVGASIFEIAYKDASKIYFDEILSNEMVAGIPYIFLPIDGVDQIEVYYTDELNVSAGSKNGLVGSYTQEPLAADGNDYILLNNQYCKVIGEAYVGANRAYFQLSGIPTSAPAPAPGVHRVSMGMAGQNTATGVDQVQGDEVPTKMIINGQLFILRGEKMYDAQGKLVR